MVFLLAITFSGWNGPAPVEKKAMSGKVLDVQNLEGLTGASVHVVELGMVAYASFDGSFEFSEIPDGSYTLEVKCVSYQTIRMEDVEVRKGQIYKKFLLTPAGL